MVFEIERNESTFLWEFVETIKEKKKKEKKTRKCKKTMKFFETGKYWKIENIKNFIEIPRQKFKHNTYFYLNVGCSINSFRKFVLTN